MDDKDINRKAPGDNSKWTKEEDERLIRAMKMIGLPHWKEMSEIVGTRDNGSIIFTFI